MDNKRRQVILFIIAYALVFVVGFRAGEIYNRMKRGYKAEGIVVPVQGSYYVVEERDYGTYRYTDIFECGTDHVLIKCLLTEKLKPLLKSKNIQIYDMNGDRVY
jgi:hypothetical protein